jgi:hypothetical protein
MIEFPFRGVKTLKRNRSGPLFQAAGSNIESTERTLHHHLDAFISRGLEPDQIWYNDGAGNFTDSEQRLTNDGGSGSLAVALGDLDGDSDIDAFVTNRSEDGNNSVWLNDGSGVFTASNVNIPALGASGDGYDVALADVDSDGDLDAFIAVGREQADRLLLNDGTGIFTDSGQRFLPPSLAYSARVVLGDVDGDSDVDAVIGSDIEGQYSHVWLNDGAGNFFVSTQELTLGSPYDLVLADIDEDGDPDLIAADIGFRNDSSNIWLNHGNGVFSEQTNSLRQAHTSSLGVADLDGDLDIDLVFMKSGRLATVLFNVDAPVPIDVHLPASSGTFELVS